MLAIDLAIAGAAVPLAFLLRHNFRVDRLDLDTLVVTTLIGVGTAALAFELVGTHRALGRRTARRAHPVAAAGRAGLPRAPGPA